MKVSVDREACIGAGTCVVVAPEYFELDDEGLAVAIQTEVKAGDEGLVRDAEQGCPAQAII
ncbi:MAG: ferredoxin, partial [Anaerolineae bacterium]|nr:ferredoxin [Anaerolineae bacterium]